jgi:nucleoside-diphosphate-sugar epimerase
MSEYKNKTFFLTGGAGFIGSEITRQISTSGGNVIIYDNFSSGKKLYVKNIPNVKIINGDLKNKSLLSKSMKNCDYVINLAAYPFIPDSYHYPQEFFDVNTNGSLNVILEAKKSKRIKNFVHISTSEVYGTSKINPMNEDHPTLPHSTYAVSKLAADRAIFTIHKEHGVPAVIVRPFNSYGPRVTQPYIIPEIILQVLNGKKILKLGNIESSRDFTFVSDTARGIISSLFVDKAIGETINLGSGQTFKIKDIVKTVASILDKKISITIDKKRVRPFDVNLLICDNKKAKKLLLWEPETSFTSGLEQTITWAKENPITFKTPFKGWAKNFRAKKK